jgi:hypothetical protein
VPATPVADPLVQQHHELGTARPALAGQVASLSREDEPFAHDAILAVRPAIRTASAAGAAAIRTANAAAAATIRTAGASACAE